MMVLNGLILDRGLGLIKFNDPERSRANRLGGESVFAHFFYVILGNNGHVLEGTLEEARVRCLEVNADMMVVHYLDSLDVFIHLLVVAKFYMGRRERKKLLLKFGKSLRLRINWFTIHFPTF